MTSYKHLLVYYNVSFHSKEQVSSEIFFSYKKRNQKVFWELMTKWHLRLWKWLCKQILPLSTCEKDILSLVVKADCAGKFPWTGCLIQPWSFVTIITAKIRTDVHSPVVSHRWSLIHCTLGPCILFFPGLSYEETCTHGIVQELRSHNADWLDLVSVTKLPPLFGSSFSTVQK